MSTQYRLVQSGKTASGGCSAGQGSSEPVAPRIIIIINSYMKHWEVDIMRAQVRVCVDICSKLHILKLKNLSSVLPYHLKQRVTEW
jgi:hypothetical protein